MLAFRRSSGKLPGASGAAENTKTQKWKKEKGKWNELKRRPGRGSVLALRGAPPGPWATRAGVASGKLPESFRKPSGEFYNAPEASPPDGNKLKVWGWVLHSLLILPETFRIASGSFRGSRFLLWNRFLFFFFFFWPSGDLPESFRELPGLLKKLYVFTLKNLSGWTPFSFSSRGGFETRHIAFKHTNIWLSLLFHEGVWTNPNLHFLPEDPN